MYIYKNCIITMLCACILGKGCELLFSCINCKVWHLCSPTWTWISSCFLFVRFVHWQLCALKSFHLFPTWCLNLLKRQIKRIRSDPNWVSRAPSTSRWFDRFWNRPLTTWSSKSPHKVIVQFLIVWLYCNIEPCFNLFHNWDTFKQLWRMIK